MKKTVLLLIAILSLNACSVLYDQDPRSFSTAWDDNRLSVQVAGVGNKDPFKKDVRLNAVSYNGNVILIGQAKSEELKSTLIENIRQMEGVRMVYDQIHVKAPINLSQRSKDSWITTKVKSSLITKKQFIDANIKVVTEDGEVFLFGYLTSEQAISATEIARNIQGVKRVIQAWF